MLFQHDTSQILNRRVILSDEELNLALGVEHPTPMAETVTAAASPTPGESRPTPMSVERSTGESAS